MRLCIVNVGLYRTGTTTLATALEQLGMRSERAYKDIENAPPHLQKLMLTDPAQAIQEWYHTQGGQDRLIELCQANGYLCDGFLPLLPFLGATALHSIKTRLAQDQPGIDLKFICTQREVSSLVESELFHWAQHDLEQRVGLVSREEKAALADWLTQRAEDHRNLIQGGELDGLVEVILPLKGDIGETWPVRLQGLTIPPSIQEKDMRFALNAVGHQNQGPSEEPLAGILLTMRFDDKSQETIHSLLESLEMDPTFRYVLVLGVDSDQWNDPDDYEYVEQIKASVGQRTKCRQVIVTENDFDMPTRLCWSWDKMGTVAFEAGAHWVLFLGDDITIESESCKFHHREVYRTFCNLHNQRGLPLYLGSPWWDDTTFTGFPTFPVVGRKHFEVFQGIIPENRRGAFFNQDLDPYLMQLGLRFMASPQLQVQLRNENGGEANSDGVRYDRIHAAGVREFVAEDARFLMQQLELIEEQKAIVLDVIVPTYRIELNFLARICSLKVPKRARVTSLVVVDNPEKLMDMYKSGLLGEQAYGTDDLNMAVQALENHLRAKSHKAGQFNQNIRVRSNKKNAGASATRNKGIGESWADFSLFLDDDVKPQADLLEKYCDGIETMGEQDVGLIGLVEFPRSESMPLIHAAILMSYLTFMFEIAITNMYDHPKWAVTASLLVRRTALRFDVDYAKTGGGEDVDYCLRLLKTTGGQGRFIKCPQAKVVHEFWPGGFWKVAKHFANWAIGDSALFSRFPDKTYYSAPNAVEFFVMHLAVSLWMGWTLSPLMVLYIWVADTVVDLLDVDGFRHRCRLLKHQFPLHYLLCAQFVANAFVNVLEAGRLFGHCKRRSFGFGKRFDWHCGNLEHHKFNVRRKEVTKFALFLGIAFAFGNSIQK